MNWFKRASSLSRVVYHGSSQAFDAFDDQHVRHGGGLSFGSLRGPGFYFTSDPLAARAYGPHIIRARVTMSSPFFVEDSRFPVSSLTENQRKSIPDRYLTHQGLSWSNLTSFGFIPDEINRMLRAEGYDGIVGRETAPNTNRQHLAYIVFSLSQIAILGSRTIKDQ